MDREKLIAALLGTWPVRAAKHGLAALQLPGDVYQGNVSMWGEDGCTNSEVIDRSADLAGLVTLGAGGVPAGANELRAGIRPYQNVPDSLMGYRKKGPQREFEGTAYPHIQDVEVTFPAAGGMPRDTFRDQIKGMNPDHALERAWRNWQDALHITPIKK